MLKNLLEKNNNDKKVWFLRQAGRYLPEYQTIRKNEKSFLDFCFNKDCVFEATFQPIRRYDLDAAIIFSDILVIPYILNRDISFIDGFGPNLCPLNKGEEKNLYVDEKKLKDLFSNYQAITEIRKKLNKNKSLIGFSGGAWTLSCYMIDGNSKGGFAKSLNWLKNFNKNLEDLIDILIIYIVEHLYKQYLYGCDTLMIFESWAGIVPEEYIKSFIFYPSKRIISLLKEKGVNATFVVFPRGISKLVIDYDDYVKPDILSLDQDIDIKWAVKNFDKEKVLQGNICPQKLLKGDDDLFREIEELKECVLNRPHVFNTGHGILPQTKPETVSKVLDLLRS